MLRLALRRSGRLASTARRWSGVIPPHKVISSKVRWQPAHRPLRASIRQTLVQGLAT